MAKLGYGVSNYSAQYSIDAKTTCANCSCNPI